MKIPYNSTIVLTTMILFLLMIQIVLPNIFVKGQTYTSLENQFGNISTTELVHNNAILILNQTTQKLSYKMGENITINTELINIGNKTLDIGYCEPWIASEIKNQAGDEIWPKSNLACIPEFTFKKTIHPGEHVSVKPWSTTTPYTVISPPRLDVPGKYTVISVALFTFDVSSKGLNSVEPLWSKPLQITVTNETIPEFPFAIPILLISITSLIVFYRIKFR